MDSTFSCGAEKEKQYWKSSSNTIGTYIDKKKKEFQFDSQGNKKELLMDSALLSGTDSTEWNCKQKNYICGSEASLGQI